MYLIHYIPGLLVGFLSTFEIYIYIGNVVAMMSYQSNVMSYFKSARGGPLSDVII